MKPALSSQYGYPSRYPATLPVLGDPTLLVKAESGQAHRHVQVYNWVEPNPSRKGLDMIANVKARFSNGVLTPLEPLDLEEGKEEVVSIEDARSPDAEAPSLLEIINELQESVPQDVWSNGPSDGAKNYKHYLYGWPRYDVT